jgi:hypothetical protein
MREELLTQLMEKNDKAIWVFDLPQVATKTFIDVTKSTNAEISEDLKGKFECVWLFESPVNFYYNWKQIILSGLKLLSPEGGFLVIKSYNMLRSNEAEVLKFLTNYLLSFSEVQTYFEIKRGYRVSVFQVNKVKEDLPLNSAFKAKNKKIPKLLIKFYKVIHKLSIKR